MKKYAIEETAIFEPGHHACPGCGEAIAIRFILNTLGPDVAAVVPPSCIAIIAGAQPFSSMNIPVFQTTLESSAASVSGIKGALEMQGKESTTVIALAGDGGTYDIGFQALSSAAERNEDMIYFCLDNEGYMNTGAQKSSSTPLHAYTSSTPAGKNSRKKNLTEIMAVHQVPYTATATVGYPQDLVSKVKKAKGIRGTKVITVLTPCIDGWGLLDDAAVEISRLAVQTGIFPLYEVEDGEKYTLNHGPTGLSVSSYLKIQKRYQHLNSETLQQIQDDTDRQWKRLNKHFES